MANNDKKLHVAIIMDGNGRWAESKGKPRIRGHYAGAEAVDDTVEAAVDTGKIGTMTVYAFSTENWRRPTTEVKALWKLLHLYLKRKRKKFIKNGIRLRWLGRRDRVPTYVRKLFEEIEAETKELNKMTLVLAVDYGGRWEIAQAAANVAHLAKKKSSSSRRISRHSDNKATPELLSEEEFAECMPSPWLPDVDLLIRTAGERRISNFLIWQASYAELYFTSVLWPDFGEEELSRSLAWYSRRIRRYGGLPASAKATK